MLTSAASIHPRFSSTVAGNFFFQPLKFHFESPNLFIQFKFYLALFLLGFAFAFAKDVHPSTEQLSFPFADLRRMQLILTP